MNVTPISLLLLLLLFRSLVFPSFFFSYILFAVDGEDKTAQRMYISRESLRFASYFFPSFYYYYYYFFSSWVFFRGARAKRTTLFIIILRWGNGECNAVLGWDWRSFFRWEDAYLVLTQTEKRVIRFLLTRIFCINCMVFDQRHQGYSRVSRHMFGFNNFCWWMRH